MRNPLFDKARHVWRRHLRPLALVVLVLTSFRSAVADWNDVPTGSMKPTILEGDRIFVNKLAYGLKLPFTTWHLVRWDAPQPGEVVVFRSPADGTLMVKRVIARPGDVVRMTDNHLIINGRPLDYAGSRDAVRETLGDTPHLIRTTPGVPAMRSFGPVTVPAGEYLLLGDNRDNSADSRYFGTVERDQILGRSSAVALSFDRAHSFRPRWDRFFKPLD